MIETVLFDLDGTIIDTNELIISSFLHVMEGWEHSAPWTREQIIPHMGGTLEQQMRTFLRTGRGGRVCQRITVHITISIMKRW